MSYQGADHSRTTYVVMSSGIASDHYQMLMKWGNHGGSLGEECHKSHEQ